MSAPAPATARGPVGAEPDGTGPDGANRALTPRLRTLARRRRPWIVIAGAVLLGALVLAFVQGVALPSAARAHFGIADAPLTRFDTIVMGRRTYDPALSVGITSPYAHLRQYVVSRRLEQLDPAVTIVADDPVATVRALKGEDSPLDIYLAGGGQLAGRLLDEIDALVIKRYPVVAGAGRAAFGPDFSPRHFALDEVRSFDGGNLVEWYTRTEPQT